MLLEVIKTRSSVTQGSLTVEDVNDLLDELSSGFRADRHKDNERKTQTARIFRTFSEKCEPREIKWITRIILKGISRF
jgi:DNA ligase 4